MHLQTGPDDFSYMEHHWKRTCLPVSSIGFKEFAVVIWILWSRSYAFMILGVGEYPEEWLLISCSSHSDTAALDHWITPWIWHHPFIWIKWILYKLTKLVCPYYVNVGFYLHRFPFVILSLQRFTAKKVFYLTNIAFYKSLVVDKVFHVK